MSSHLVPECACPGCGRKLDACACRHGDHRPRSGDLTMCFYCGALLRFTDDLTVRALEPGELRALPPRQRAELELARLKVLQYRRTTHA